MSKYIFCIRLLSWIPFRSISNPGQTLIIYANASANVANVSVPEFPAMSSAVDVFGAGNYTVPVGQDVMISVYNIHHSPAVWDKAEEFLPERFPIDQPPPNEVNTDYK